MLRPSHHLSTAFLLRALESELTFRQATECATGIAQKTVPLSGLRRLLVPIAPYEEQERIVARLDELMTLCGRLEDQMESVRVEGKGALDAILHEALEQSSVGQS